MRVDVRVVLGALGALLLVLSSAFAAPVAGGNRLSPVPFDQTLSMGMTGVDVQTARARGYALPRAEAFYSQYQYVVGYYGVESAASSLGSGNARRQFGRPLGVFVTDFGGADPHLTDEGYLVAEDARVGWTPAETAHYVVDSDARTTAGPAVVPFADADAARAFADAHDGRVVGWDAIRSRARDEGLAAARSRRRELVANRTSWADARVAAGDSLLHRSRSIVVGEDAPTLSAAVAQAPPNTTVYLPPGTYETNVTITRPLTLRGAGNRTVIDGGGADRVLRANASRVAVADLRIRGVGPNGTGQGAGNATGWDANIVLTYGRGDAGVLLAGANRSLIANVTVDTRANGVLIRHSPGTVVRNLTVHGTDRWQDGFMGVLTMYSPIVVQNATFRGGRDGVYTHRSPGTVVRDSEMHGLRYGVHEMYTSRTLVANNTVTDSNMGAVVMTSPRANVLSHNRVRNCEVGIEVSGDASYVWGNVLVDNDIGMTVGASRSLYTNNTVVGNHEGIHADTIVPTNTVIGNDVVGNDRPATVGGGPVHVWTAAGRGNYWAGARGLDRDGDGVLDRPYRPSDPVDRVLGRSRAGTVAARAPTLGLLRQLQAATPGLRHSAVVDTGPLAAPVRPGVLAEVNAT
ncbi:MAG: right-handed parallel beta-helix repeat-containing protein [Haloarculaceae archaeon]